MKEKGIFRPDAGITASLIFLMLVLPFSHTAGVQSGGYLTAAVLWCAGIALRRKINFVVTPVNLPVFLFVFTALCSVVTSLHFRYSFDELRGELGTYLLIFFIAANNLRPAPLARGMAWALFAGSFIISVLGIVQYFSGNGRIASLTADVNYLSATLILMFPYAAVFWCLNVFPGRWAKVVFCLLTLSILACIAFTLSRGAYVALLVEIALLLSVCRRQAWRLVAICLAGAILAFAFVPERTATLFNIGRGKIDSPSIARLEVNEFGLRQIAAHPFSGIGYGKRSLYKSFPAEPVVEKVGHLHNVFLETALETGLPGLACFIWLLLVLGLTLKRCYKTLQEPFAKAFLLASILALCGYVMRCQFDHLYVDNLARLFWLLMGTAISIGVNAGVIGRD